jgi:pyruvate,water dikinase
MSSTNGRNRFPSPYDLTAPPGAEGWQDIYPYFLVFREDRREVEDKKFWFCDSMHWPRVFKPFDVIMVEYAIKCLGQYNTRQWLIPPANGLDYHIHGGYLYMSPIGVPPEQIEGRVPQFLERAGYYFQNWDRLQENWMKKVRAVIDELESITFEPLPEVVDKQWVFDGRGLDNTWDLITNYDRAIQLAYKAWQYHFEFLNLGYAAYLDFFMYCKATFPNIPDQGIAKMVQGIDVDLFRPDDELKKLAKLAVKLGVAQALKSGTVEEALAATTKLAAGRQWLEAWQAAQDPWFNYTAGNGFYSDDKWWRDHLDIPLGFLRMYIERVEAGHEIERPTAAVAAERERITNEYMSLLPDDEARAAFQGKLGLARTVFPYVENHNFYIEHWALGVFWRKMRQLSRVLMNAGFWHDEDDMFYLRREELTPTLFDYGNAWAVGIDAVGPAYWPPEIARRKKIVQALMTQPPQPALNEPPEVITEPFTIMLWGITTDGVARWLGGEADSGKLMGMAASPGAVEGNARVIHHADELDQVLEGEILVAPVTAPSWAPVFARIKATVTDIGGMMSHAAIVCLEYGLPAVTGTGNASQTIKTGQRISVDGSNGEVVILN